MHAIRQLRGVYVGETNRSGGIAPVRKERRDVAAVTIESRIPFRDPVYVHLDGRSIYRDAVGHLRQSPTEVHICGSRYTGSALRRRVDGGEWFRGVHVFDDDGLFSQVRRLTITIVRDGVNIKRSVSVRKEIGKHHVAP